MVKGKDVKAVPRDDDIPLGWRLASIEEIKGSAHSTYTQAALDAIRKTPTKREYFCIDDDYQVFERRYLFIVVHDFCRCMLMIMSHSFKRKNHVKRMITVLSTT